MAKDKWGYYDIFRIVSLLLLTIFVGFIVEPVAPWVFWIAIFGNFYIVSLEFLKFYVGLKELRSGQKKEFVILGE
jgi:hypothetical protein